MKFLLSIIAAVALLASPVGAADLAVKAPPLGYNLPTYPSGSGLFFGLGASGLGGTAGGDVLGGTIIGATVSGSVGYTRQINPTYFVFVEQMAKATILNGASSALKISESTEFETRFAVGAPTAVIAQWVNLVGLGNAAMPTVPNLPNSLSIAPMSSYGFASVHASDVSAQVLTGFGTSWLFSWGVGFGTLYRISNGMVLDTSVEYVHQSTGLLAGISGQTVKFNDKFEAMVSVKF